jgi:hypothetical protein
MTHSRSEKAFVPIALVTGNPTNPFTVPFPTSTPDGLAHVGSAPNPAEAELTRQTLIDAGFHVEYVPSVTTGVFGTTGSVHVYVRASEKNETCEFLRQLQQTGGETQDEEDEDATTP